MSSPAAQQLQRDQDKEKLAIQYYENKEYEKALGLFRELFDAQPSQFRYTYLIYCLLAVKDFAEAEKVVKSRIKAEPGALRYEVDLGYVYMMMGRPDRGNKQFDDILGKMKPNRAGILEIANAFTSRQQYDYAVKAYLKGRELMQYQDMFHLELARTYELTGNFTAMIDEYLDMLLTDPSKLELVQNRMQNSLSRDMDDRISDALRESLLRRTQRNPDNRYYSEMLLWLSIQRKDFSFALVQARAIDTRFNEGGGLVYNIGNLSLGNGDYGVAIEAFGYLLNKGPLNPYYAESMTGTLQAKYLRIVEGYDSGPKELQQLKSEYLLALDELGRTPRSIYLMRDLAHLQAFYLDELEEAVELLEQAVAIPGANEKVKAEVKLELGDIYLFQGEVWEATLLYSQVEKAFKADPIGHEAKFRNARFSYFIGEFEWAKAQLNVLKAATSKLIANDAMELSLLISDNMEPDSTYTGLAYFSRADLQIYRGQDDLALQTLDSVRMIGLTHPLNDDVLYRKAEIFIRKKDFAKADSLLAKVVSDYGFDLLADNALFRRAELQSDVFQNPKLAMELYQQLILDYPGSLFVTEARKRFRQIRGDYPN